ncbi:hypothetical protein X975_20459, partial [Stegodyphus mimosarum]
MGYKPLGEGKMKHSVFGDTELVQEHKKYCVIISSQNPADIASRGCTVRQLVKAQWWNGPEWLKENLRIVTYYELVQADESLTNSEKRKCGITATNIINTKDLFYNKGSSYKKIVRMIAWIKRLGKNARNLPKDHIFGNITFAEYAEAENILLKLIQEESFESHQDKTIISLQPLWTRKDIRTMTKICQRNDSRNFQFPIILPPNHVISNLLIKEKHEENSHARIQALMAILREHFWILKCRRTVHLVIKNCGRCRCFKVTNFDVNPIPLPEERVTDSAVFQITGDGLAGPLYLRGQKKAWIVIFTCAVYQAILKLLLLYPQKHLCKALENS